MAQDNLSSKKELQVVITAMKNKYINRFRISDAKFKEIVKYFLLRLAACNFARSLDIEAVKIAKLSKISRQSINKIIKNIRVLIAIECENISKMQGEIEIDESYFSLRFVL